MIQKLVKTNLIIPSPYLWAISFIGKSRILMKKVNLASSKKKCLLMSNFQSNNMQMNSETYILKEGLAFSRDWFIYTQKIISFHSSPLMVKLALSTMKMQGQSILENIQLIPEKLNFSLGRLICFHLNTTNHFSSLKNSITKEDTLWLWTMKGDITPKSLMIISQCMNKH